MPKKEHHLWLERLGVRAEDFYNPDPRAIGDAGGGNVRVARGDGGSSGGGGGHIGEAGLSGGGGNIRVAGGGGAAASGGTRISASGRAVASEWTSQTPSGDKTRVSLGEIQGEFNAGDYEDPTTGARLTGVKMSGKAVGAEVNADTPLGKVSGSLFKAEGSATIGYDYDPESKVEFAGVKASGSISVLDEKIEGKYGNISGQLLSASVSTKTGVEIDEKTGKIFIGTANSAEAKVAEISGTLQNPNGSASLTGGVQVLKASAALDANAVVDKYGIDFNAKAGAEANLVKVEGGGEVRLTPKALFDNTVGWMTGMSAPDFFDFGPVLGAKVSAGEGIGATVEGGGRLGADEVNVRGGGFIELGEGVGLDFKAGMRLGPVKTLVDNKEEVMRLGDEAITRLSNAGAAIEEGVGKVAGDIGAGVANAGATAASTAYNVAADVGQGAFNVASQAANTAYNVGSAVASGVAGVASGVGSTVSNVASDVASGVAGVASGAASTVSNIGSDIADTASNTWNSLFG